MTSMSTFTSWVVWSFGAAVLSIICSFFFLPTCGPNWTRACSHIIGYIPVHIGLLFYIPPTYIWNGNSATHSCTWALRKIGLMLHMVYIEKSFKKTKCSNIYPQKRELFKHLSQQHTLKSNLQVIICSLRLYSIVIYSYLCL